AGPSGPAWTGFSGPAAVAFCGRDEGDFGPGAGPGGAGSVLEARQRAVVDRPWKTVRQVHGRRVLTVDDGAADLEGEEADALVTASADVALAVKTADCAPVALASAEGVVAVAHAGWRGVAEGVLAETVRTMRDLGATDIEAAVGPCIGPECYEFSTADLDAVAARLGQAVRATTGAGRPALDLPAAVRAALDGLGVRLVHEAGVCTACDGSGTRWFSHRARAETQRQATVVWRR
ncbi:MAG: polyphenol oxidase family protein, partial [Actinobacteria bacterium]|nr:polyphenol oxidase family protein [Actinomycetota bacterium]